MKTKTNTKKPYKKPIITMQQVDNNITLVLMSENTIPDSPPWADNNAKQTDPYKIDKA